MKPLSKQDQNEIIQSWHERAGAYDQLIQRWPIFNNMVSRLLEFLPNDFDGHALDIAAGTGLLAKQLLEKHPNASVTAIEPAGDMRSLAKRALGNSIEIINSTSDSLDKLGITADAALCNASFHLMNEEATLASVASVLNKGSVFAVNCWGHSFKEAQALNRKSDWMAYIDQALAEINFPAMKRPSKATPNLKSTESLSEIAACCGLHLAETEIITTEIETKFNIDFAAMSSNFLAEVDADIRKQVIARASILCEGVDTISSVDLCFKKL